MIRLKTDLNEVIGRGGTVIVPSRQRAHAARLAHAAAELGSGRRVWATPDILPLDAWLTREVERHAAAAGGSLPRLLSPAEDWLLWRQCAAEATGELELVNRSALAEGLRRANALAAEFAIDVSKLRDLPGTESALLYEVRRAVAALPDKQRAAVLMHKYEEMEYSQIANVLICSESAVKSLLFRAYETLRSRLAHMS